MSGLALRPAVRGDMAGCAAIFDAWVEATDWMPRIHPPEDVARHYEETLFDACAVTVGETDGRLAGFLALGGEGRIEALYVAADARRRGVGGALVGAAKAARPEGLSLWTFLANEGARTFYAGQGFVEWRRTAGENEEGLADVMLVWRGRP